jgi:cytochrome c oxidase cbb3-type subunit II
MERLGASFLIAGVVTFLLGFFLQGVMPMITLRKLPVASVEEVAQDVPPEFFQLAEDYPEEFSREFGEPNPASLARALREGKAIYQAEACWHCHSQFVRPVSNEDLRFGPVSTPAEYQNEMNLPHLFGTRRVGPDLIRESGVHSNDWHMAHLWDPRSVAPYSVMPSYPWFFDAERRPTRRALALVAYLQWLGSWIEGSSQ